MKEDFEKQRKEYKELIENTEEFDKNVFKNYFKLGNNITKLSNELSEKVKEKERFENWREKVKAIDNNLKAIKVNEK